MEFAINLAINGASKFTLFELNYGWMPTMITGIPQFTSYEGVKQFAKQAVHNLDEAHNVLMAFYRLQYIKSLLNFARLKIMCKI
jgi:hypothetical protein